MEEEKKSNKKQNLLLVLGLIAFIGLVGGVTYAFFNYTRTGAGNTIRVGRIAFISRQTETINLTNLFPIDPTETGIMDDDEKVGTLEIEIEGDTDYVDGVEYLISTVNSSITSNGKTIPISLDVTVTNLGTSSDDYFTARESKNATIYKKLIGNTLTGDEQVLVGYIKPNTTYGTKEGVNGKITIKAYLDKNKILISDTYNNGEEPTDNMGTPVSMGEGKTVFTTTEWNALQSSGVSFKIKVEANEGIWVEEVRTLYGIMQASTIGVDIENGVDFSKTSDQDNTKGVYTFNGTESDTYPVYYYRGAVEDNNVIFNNMCWKAVRTTDTGGVKLIYNGELKEIIKNINYGREYYSEEITNTGAQFSFDTESNEWVSIGATEMSFSIIIPGNYTLNYTAPSNGPFSFKKNGTEISSLGGEQSIYLENVSENDVFSFSYTPRASGSQLILFSLFTGETINLGFGCDNTGTDTHINILGTNMFAFNTSYNSPAYVGYMYGDVYIENYRAATSGAFYGSSFTYDGTNYTLVDPVTTKNNTHHYTCNLTSRDGTCATIRYYYCENNYVNLTGGEGIEQAIEKMQTNTNDSNAKTQIDNWYASNMNTVTSELEDTIWCNDRSMGNGNNNGWIANGGDLNTYLYYGAAQRSNLASNTSSVKNQPSLVCVNKNDAFTVSNVNGNQKLTYPVALLTEDEMVLAGGLAGSSSTFYLNNGSYYWSLSPSYFSSDDAYVFHENNGGISGDYVGDAYGLRPSVSLKPGTLVMKGGEGTASNPFVILN